MSTLTEIRENLQAIYEKLGKVHELAKSLGEQPNDCNEANLATELDIYASEAIDENATIDALVRQYQAKEKK